MSSTLSWQLPSPEPRLAAHRYLLRRRDCLQPIRAAVFQHPDLAPMIRALFAFATTWRSIRPGNSTRPSGSMTMRTAGCGHAPSCRSRPISWSYRWPMSVSSWPASTCAATRPCGYHKPAHHCRTGCAVQHGEVVLHSMAADARSTITVEVAALLLCRARAPAPPARQQAARDAADSRPC